MGYLERSTSISLLLPRLTDQEVIGLEKFINVGACCSFLVVTVLISQDLQVMRTSLFLFAVFFFLAPGKTSTLAGKVIGGGGPERGSVSVSSRAQLALECCDPPPLAQEPCRGDQRLFSSNASAGNPLHLLLSKMDCHRFEDITICQERYLLVLPSLTLTKKNLEKKLKARLAIGGSL